MRLSARHRLGGWIMAALLIAVPALAQAQEPSGCDKFKWPLDRERALMAKAVEASLGSAADPKAAVRLALRPQAEAALPMAPERAPKATPAYAGFVRFTAPVQAGTYRITISANAWIDVVQDGKFVHAGEFSGVAGCEGLRKSVKFALRAAPFVLQLSGAAVESMTVIVTQD